MCKEKGNHHDVGALIAGVWLIPAAAALLLAPALLWGRPFVFGDTAFYWGWGGDILDSVRTPWPHPGAAWIAGRTLHSWGLATHNATEADLRAALTLMTARSAFYATPFRLLTDWGGLWLVASIQALVSAWVVRVTQLAALQIRSRSTYFGIVGALAVFSTLGFEVSLAMPDIFGGLAVASAIVLIVYSGRLNFANRAGLSVLIGYSCLAHMENGLNMAAAVLVAVAWYARRREGWPSVARRVAPVAGALSAAVVIALLGGALLKASFGRPPQTPPFFAARLFADGGAQRFLRMACPHQRFAACDLADVSGPDSEYYLWFYPFEPPPVGASAPLKSVLARYDRLLRRHVTDAEAEQRERYLAEQPQLVLGTLRIDGPHQAHEAYVNGLAAFLNFGVGRDFDTDALIVPAGPSELRSLLAALLPGDECQRAGTCGRFDLGAAAPLQYATVLASCVALLAMGLSRAWRPTGDMTSFLALILALVVVNAFICGPISGPYARYQARVEWLIPFCALLLFARRRATAPTTAAYMEPPSPSSGGRTTATGA